MEIFWKGQGGCRVVSATVASGQRGFGLGGLGVKLNVRHEMRWRARKVKPIKPQGMTEN